MPTRTITFNLFSTDDGGPNSPWLSSSFGTPIDGLYTTNAPLAGATTNGLTMIALANQFAGLTGQIPVSITFTGRLFSTNGTQETGAMTGDYTYFSGVTITPIAAGNNQVFPTLVLPGTKAQRKAQLAVWLGGTMSGIFKVTNGAAGVETTSVDGFTFQLTTISARNRRRELASKRGWAGNR